MDTLSRKGKLVLKWSIPIEDLFMRPLHSCGGPVDFIGIDHKTNYGRKRKKKRQKTKLSTQIKGRTSRQK